LIAGLAEMVVVVECHAQGGSWHTVDAAIKRGTDVGAVPGSVLSPASAGTNRLLHEGAAVVRGAADVLDALGAAPAATPAGVPGPGTRGQASLFSALEDAVLASVGRRPACLDEIVERSGLPTTAVVVALERLEDQGAVSSAAGWWAIKR
jgi:DNA processing protein